MGSLYDMGNFRYKHFTFYTCGSDSCSTSDEDTHTETDKQIVKFLDAVWPFNAIIMGESAEGDYAFVTYVNQSANLNIEVENIYTYVRVSQSEAAPPTWVRAITPIKSLNPFDE